MDIIYRTTEIIIKYLEEEGIYVGTKETQDIVEKWQAKLHLSDAIDLAAVAIANPNEIAISKAEIREFRQFFFPSINYIESNLR